jgi:hypothetical protein
MVSLFSNSVTEGRFRSNSCFGSDIILPGAALILCERNPDRMTSPSFEVNLACSRVVQTGQPTESDA